LITYRDPSAGFELPLPETWELLEGPSGHFPEITDPEGRGPAIALIAVAPEGGEPFRPVLVVASEPHTGDVELDGWVDAELERLRRSVNRLFVIDAEPVEIGGTAGWRTLAQHAVEGVGAVTLERWLLLDPSRGWTITAASGTLEYAATADILSTAARGFRLVGEPVP